MKPYKFFIPFLIAFFFLAISFRIMDQNARALGMGAEIPPPPHLEPNPIQSPGSGRVNQSSTSSLKPLTASGVITNVLDTGDNQIHGLIYSNGSLWASTRTNPARILRINPSTLTVEN